MHLNRFLGDEKKLSPEFIDPGLLANKIFIYL